MGRRWAGGGQEVKRRRHTHVTPRASRRAGTHLPSAGAAGVAVEQLADGRDWEDEARCRRKATGLGCLRCRGGFVQSLARLGALRDRMLRDLAWHREPHRRAHVPLLDLVNMPVPVDARARLDAVLLLARGCKPLLKEVGARQRRRVERRRRDANLL